MPILNPLSADTFKSHQDTTPDPAAGAEATIGISAQFHSIVHLISFTLVTDANAGSRVVWISDESSIPSIPLGSAAFSHPASTTYNYICHTNAVTNAAGNIRDLMIPLPNMRVSAATRSLKINIDGIKAGDQLSDIFHFWSSWLGNA